MSLEEYLKGVVAAEMPADFELELSRHRLLLPVPMHTEE